MEGNSDGKKTIHEAAILDIDISEVSEEFVQTN
jgi:hypothetical protein